MAYVCADVPRLTTEVQAKQNALTREISRRDDARAKLERKGNVWEGSPQQVFHDAEVAEAEAELAEAQANLAEAQADCG